MSGSSHAIKASIRPIRAGDVWVKDIPGVWDGLQKFYKKNRNNKGNGNAIVAVVVIAVAALAIGCLLTRWIICTNMGKEALPAREAA